MIFVSVLHLLGAVFIIGPMAILPMVGLSALRKGSFSMVLNIARTTRWLTYLSLAVAIAGFGLIPMADPADHLSVTTPWILASIVVYLIAFLLSATVVVPQLFRAAKVAAPTGGEGTTRYPALAMSSGITAILLVLVVVLMVWRP
jgi:uncharacterized membrane protein